MGTHTAAMAHFFSNTSTAAAEVFLEVGQVAAPVVLLLVYLIAFTVYSVRTARNDNDISPPGPQLLGPGGKPLPSNKSNNQRSEAEQEDFSAGTKRTFQVLTGGVLVSLFGNIVMVIVHALTAREEHWWCGQTATVGVKYASPKVRKLC